MSRIVRASKVRHVFCEPAKHNEQFQGLRISSATGDHNYIKANNKFIAYPVATGGGALTIVTYDQKGKLNASLPVIDGHKGAVLDFDFNPFNEHLIASGGDDCTIKLWQIPEEGLESNLMLPMVDMAEHMKKVSVLRFHPTANNVLASGSADQTVKVWDVQRGEAVATNTDSAQLLQDVAWSYDGSVLASSSKDKQMRLIDPRTGETTASIVAHDGTKTSKLVFAGASGNLCTVGFTRSSKRQVKLWDPRQLDQALSVVDIDQASGALMPFYDDDMKMLYLAGKGDANVRFYEIADGEAHFLSEYRATKPCKGMAMVPKLKCDTTKCEIARFLKLTKDAIEPLSIICPRKSDLFQKDLYPDTYAGRAVLSAEEFFAGKDCTPILTSMDPSKREDFTPRPAQTFKAAKSARELEQDLTTAKEYISLLRAKLEAADLEVPNPPTVIA